PPWRPSIASWQMRSGRRSLSRCWPRLRSATPGGSDADARSDATSDSRTWPPLPALPMRAARWTSAPMYSPSASSDPSPVWRPIRPRTSAPSGHASAARLRWASTAAATPPVTSGKTAKMPSPSVFSSCPPAARIDARMISGGRARSAVQASIGSACASFVEPSMSVNRKVTVPTGLALVGACASTSVMLLLRDGPQAAGQSAEDREGERRRLQQGLLEVPAREAQAARRLAGHDLGGPRQAVENGQLAEEVARPQDCHLVAAAHDLHRARHDQEEARPDLALAGDHVVRREVHLDGPSGDRREVGRRHAGEEPASG